MNKDEYDAIVNVPIETIVVTSTTHIPVLEALNAEHTLIGFPDTKYISSPKTRALITNGQVKELGNNEAINTEMLLALQPELVVGFIGQRKRLSARRNGSNFSLRFSVLKKKQTRSSQK